jgi:hypothetical protein
MSALRIEDELLPGESRFLTRAMLVLEMSAEARETDPDGPSPRGLLGSELTPINSWGNAFLATAHRRGPLTVVLCWPPQPFLMMKRLVRINVER